MNNQQQIEVIKGCAVNDSQSQRALFIAFSEELLATCRRFMGTEDEAKDILQDSFIRIFKHAHTFDPEGGSLKGWMKTICIRIALRQLEKNKRTASMDELKHIPTVDPVAVQNLDMEELYYMINKLPEKQRTVFNLFVVEGYSHGEIAEILDLNETCSRTILSRTKRVLKEKLINVNLGFGRASYAY
ncbi:MAG: RNA polymerase sigma factor (sigma-70 family) [Saprospiraceae bacterium]|jgi:RNA polymerase sigma factor (sigma-70 family)